MAGVLVEHTVPARRTEPSPSYVEHAPDAAVRDWVECLWTREPTSLAETPSHRILPDGCVDLILAVESGRGAGANPRPVQRADLVGAMTRPLVVRANPVMGFIGVRCRPGAARALFGVPACELTDARVAVSELWPEAELVLERAASAPCPSEQRAIVAHAVARRLAAAPRPPRDVSAAVTRMMLARGQLRIESLCRDLGVTRQHLARRFAEHVGVTPKTFARIVRVRHVMRAATRSPSAGWSGIALDAGYVDQAHLIGDFGELVGLTPARWLARQGRSTDGRTPDG